MDHSRSEKVLGHQIVNSLDRLFKIILQMAWLNFLWFLFTLLGLIVGGIFPATTAAISVARKWIRNKTIDSTFQTFKETYRTEFKTSNIVGFSLVSMGALLVLNYYALLKFGEQIPVFIVFAYYFIIFIFSISLVWLFPLLSHYDAMVTQHFKNALIIGFIRLPTTVSIIVSIFLIIYVSLKLPSLLLFFSVSLIALSIAFLTDRIFKEIDNKNISKNIRTTDNDDSVS